MARAANTPKQNTREAEDSPESVKAEERAEAVREGAATLSAAPDQSPAAAHAVRGTDGGGKAKAAAKSPPEVTPDPAEVPAGPERRRFTALADILHDQELVAAGGTLALTEAQHGALRARVAENWDEDTPEADQD